jgi:hypothetical protein
VISVVKTIADVQKKRFQIIVRLLANKCTSLSAICLAKDAIATDRPRIVLKPSHGPYTVLLPITSSLLQPKAKRTINLDSVFAAEKSRCYAASNHNCVLYDST